MESFYTFIWIHDYIFFKTHGTVHLKGMNFGKVSIQILCPFFDIAYMWNLKKGYKGTYLQNRNRVTDVENKLMVTGG